MGWKRRFEERLGNIEKALAFLIKREKEKEAEESVLVRELERLRGQNDLLLDRLMARDLTELKLSQEMGGEKVETMYSPEFDEGLAGEVFSMEEGNESD